MEIYSDKESPTHSMPSKPLFTNQPVHPLPIKQEAYNYSIKLEQTWENLSEKLLKMEKKLEENTSKTMAISTSISKIEQTLSVIQALLVRI
jgi:hypothetical protein